MGSRSLTAALWGWIKIEQDKAKQREKPENKPLLSPQLSEQESVRDSLPGGRI
jgi:hypothetical protein